MEIRKHNFQTIDAYIAACPEAIHKKLQELRTTIKASAPDAVEKISYQIPTFYLNGNLLQPLKIILASFLLPAGERHSKRNYRPIQVEKERFIFPLINPCPWN